MKRFILHLIAYLISSQSLQYLITVHIAQRCNHPDGIKGGFDSCQHCRLGLTITPVQKQIAHTEKKKGCTHSFGLAGGFKSCSACGINPKTERRLKNA